MLRASLIFFVGTVLHDPDAAALMDRSRCCAQQPAPRRRADAHSPIDERTAGMQKIDGYFPLYWDERTGSLFLEIPRFDTEFLLHDRPRRRPRVERHRPRSRRRRRRPRRLVPARRPAGPAGAAEPVVPLEQRQPARAQVGRGFVRQVGAVGLHRRRRERRPRARRRHRLPAARRARRRQRAAARHLPRRSHAQRVLPAAHEGVPEEHRDRDDADLRQRRRPAAAAAARADRRRARADRRRRRRGAAAAAAAAASSPASVASVTPTRRRGDAARARVARRAARTTTTSRAPTIRAPATAASPSSTTACRSASRCSIRYIRRHRLEKKDPSGGDERAGEADSVLGRFGRAGRREEGAGRRRELVEPGVRSRRVPQRLQGRRAARRRRPDGHPLQHDQLGPPLDARLELGRHRSPIRAPARSSRRRSRSDRCAIGRTT